MDCNNELTGRTQMASTVRDVMTANPRSLPSTATASAAAMAMRDIDAGAILVTEAERMCGVVTDRDLVVRVLAEDRDPATTPLGEICSRDVSSVSPETPIAEAVAELRGRSVRRLPVVEEGRPVGIVTLGDLAVEKDPQSALGQISAAPPST
jgi:signal-transduction protein with cAMP-binding, CBS, and nucleotidyltransferase domain